ncbi:hypothetical protein THII_0318 [Thioploca ingrica]|uniref:SMODS and SLOG-associating 2TM effector domain-containing protein n=1 Tax=Thioploca ingrica TaxID=40754 RepID=A0A090AIG7_9GAMM|nr:hypothetical protein THII_0318 [Thioploca ingrica]
MMNSSTLTLKTKETKVEPNLGSSKTITFPNGHSASLVTVAPKTNLQSISTSLQLTPTSFNALIILSGGAAYFEQLERGLQLRLQQLFGRGIVRAATEIGAGFISGGTDSGVIALLGKSVAEYHCQCPLIGIAPAPLITYPAKDISAEGALSAEEQVPLEPHHTHFVLVETPQWGGETETMYSLVSACRQQTENLPIFTVLVNGGEISRLEILQSVRLGIPIIVIAGSGRLADEIATLHREYQDSKDSDSPKFIEDPALAEIITEGKINLFSIEGEATELKRLIHRAYRQSQGDTVLQVAWRRFSLYDYNATRQQHQFHYLQLAILGFGILGTTLALIQKEWDFSSTSFLHYLIVLVPIISTILLAAANRFNAGTKWILLRTGAEEVKLEIFRYRAQAEIYSPTNATAPEVKFAEKLQTIAQGLVQTEVNVSSLHQPKREVIPPPNSVAPDDDGLSILSPERYINTRLEDQLRYYTNKVKKLENRLKTLQWLIYAIGGLGTFLAAINLELWIALTTAFVTALATYMEYQQIESTLIKYNQSATDLFSVRTWWIALSETEQAKQYNIDRLVGQTERILQSEFRGWMKEMQETLADLKKQQGEEQSSPPETGQPADKTNKS